MHFQVRTRARNQHSRNIALDWCKDVGDRKGALVMPLRWTQVTDHSAVAFKQVLQTMKFSTFFDSHSDMKIEVSQKKDVETNIEKDIKPQNYLQNI